MSMDAVAEVAAPAGGVLMSRSGRWTKVAMVAAVFLGLALFAGRFYKQSFDGIRDRGAMDIAQISKNIADGHGFTTRWVRPFSVTLVPPFADRVPEVNSAPLYPYIVATLFKLRASSDQVVAWASLLSFASMLFATFVLGCVLFNWRAGLLAAVGLGVSADALSVGTSGREWAFAAFWFTLALIGVGLHHNACLNGRRTSALWAASVAVAVVAVYMTHQLLVILALPLAVYFGVTRAVPRRDLVVFVLVTVVLATPWAYRNMSVARFAVIGANAWDLMANTSLYPGDTIYRVTDPALQSPWRVLVFPLERFSDFARKLLVGSDEMVTTAAGLIGVALLPFAAVSTLYRFRQPSANAVRGLIYGAAPVLIMTLAVFSVDPRATLLLVPIAAVLGSAYFLLLLDAKKLHPFFQRALIGLFVLIASVQAIPVILWPQHKVLPPPQEAAEAFFRKLGNEGVYRVYTDQPWLASWRTLGYGIWLPRTDADASALASKCFPLETVVLTSESDSYAEDEIWYQLHRVRAWREYVADPDSATPKILEQAGIDDKTAPAARKYLQRLRREFAVSQSVAGLSVRQQDPLAPEDVLLFVSPGVQ